jgi:hypothetical protein
MGVGQLGDPTAKPTAAQAALLTSRTDQQITPPTNACRLSALPSSSARADMTASA